MLRYRSIILTSFQWSFIKKKITGFKLSTMHQEIKQDNKNFEGNRRNFIKKGLVVSFSGFAGLSLLAGCKDEKGEEKEVSPPEDLMQEHGVLKRVLLIYDACRIHLINKETLPADAITNSANIIRRFIEDYHEKQEENYLFPRFRKANQLTDLVDTLFRQHQAGRRVTDEIMQLAKTAKRTDNANGRLTQLLLAFNTMYNPHEAREDTVLFPAFRKLVSKHEYDSLGEGFEKNEEKMFGKGGFEKYVDKVATIEKSLGIYDLAQFTPKI
jgi:hemerythrin-like domain-containing protein